MGHHHRPTSNHHRMATWHCAQWRSPAQAQCGQLLFGGAGLPAHLHTIQRGMRCAAMQRPWKVTSWREVGFRQRLAGRLAEATSHCRQASGSGGKPLRLLAPFGAHGLCAKQGP